MKNIGENVVRIEAEALRALADRIAGPMDESFQRAVDLMFCCVGRVVVTGMGKSGLIARKIAATLSSTGTPALYLHPVEALHGDLGMVVRGDVVLVLSASGETEEILALLATIKRLQVPLITMTGDEICGLRAVKPISNHSSNSSAKAAALPSTLASAADVALDCSIAQEACALGLAPTASTTTMLALGDALAVTLSERQKYGDQVKQAGAERQRDDAKRGRLVAEGDEQDSQDAEASEPKDVAEEILRAWALEENFVPHKRNADNAVRDDSEQSAVCYG